MNIKIFGLDNCISDNKWRLSSQNESHIEKYHELCLLDSIANFRLIKPLDHVIIFTARPIKYKPETEKWLKMKGINYLELKMRSECDERSEAEIKLCMLREFLSGYLLSPKIIDCAFDDDQDVIDMYRSQGVLANFLKIN